jgi:hypothetical protein
MRVTYTLAAFVVTSILAASAARAQPRITRIEFTPATADEGGGVWIGLLGTGTCTYGIEFGDGQTERRTADLPDRMRHVYEADKAYDVVATPEAPCEGVARAKLDVRPVTQGIWGLKVEPAGSTDSPAIVLTIDGRGTCTVTLEFGDGKQEKVEGALPARVNHTYPSTGSYDITARTEAPCRGEARVNVDVRSRVPGF